MNGNYASAKYSIRITVNTEADILRNKRVCSIYTEQTLFNLAVIRILSYNIMTIGKPLAVTKWFRMT